MIKLIKLEWKKNAAGKYIRNAVLMTVILSLLIFGLTFWDMAVDPDTGLVEVPVGYEGISPFIEVLTHMCYLCFSAVMLASFIVSSYKNKRMSLMFSYPISRKKILASQMLAVWIFNVTAAVLSKLFLYIAVFLGSQYKTPAFLLDFNLRNPEFYFRLFISSAVMISISFVALFIGLLMNSSKATIISSIILICLTQGNIGSLTLAHNILFYIILLLFSFAAAVFSILQVENKDL